MNSKRFWSQCSVFRMLLPPLPADDVGDAGSGLTVAQSRWGEDAPAVGGPGGLSRDQEAQEDAQGAERHCVGAWRRKTPTADGESGPGTATAAWGHAGDTALLPGGFVSLCEICGILPQVCKLERCLQPPGTC